MHPERYGSSTGTLPSEIVASIVNNQANIVVLCKFHASSYVGRACDIDGIL
jgi:hypothetical protein